VDSKPEIAIEYASVKYAKSYNEAVDSVARERKYLAATQGFGEKESIEYVEYMTSNNFPQYFAIHEGKVIGWCDITPKEIKEFSHVGVLGIGLINKMRGQGIGTRLLEKAIHHARFVNQLEKVELEVFTSNISAISVYKKAGFSIEGIKSKSRKIDNEYDDDVIMGLFL
jgi:RimJ/RimL family protein N-acetyltransferase